MANPLEACRADARAGHVARITEIAAAGAYVRGHARVVDGGHRVASPQLGTMS